jgi:murein DD-endopeptidase MepM/ murein hydrolase activator NlpD
MIAAGLGLVALLAASGTSAVPAPAPVRPPASEAGASQASRFVFRGALTQGSLVVATAPPGTSAVSLDGTSVPMAADGQFVIAFGRDHPPTALLTAERAGGVQVSETLRIAPRSWSVQSLPTLPRGTSPSAEFLRRRSAELAQIEAARAVNAESDGWRQRFLWPVTGRISGVFGSQRIYAGEPGAFHSGVDVARPSGTPVVSPADGIVVLAAASPFTLEGNLLIVDHGMGVTSAFLHLARIDVACGTHVSRGQLIGAIGTTGRSTGPHLHWAMKWRDQRIDPAVLAGPMTGAG